MASEARDIVWAGAPYMPKTLAKFLLFYAAWLAALLALLAHSTYTLTPSDALVFAAVWMTPPLLLFAPYYYWKKSFRYTVTRSSLLIEHSWLFGAYEREIPLARVLDVHVIQGFLGRLLGCGDVVFTTSAGLEVGYRGAGGGAAVSGFFGGGGVVAPALTRGRHNTFMDVREPHEVRRVIGALISQGPRGPGAG